MKFTFYGRLSSDEITMHGHFGDVRIEGRMEGREKGKKEGRKERKNAIACKIAHVCTRSFDQIDLFLRVNLYTYS